MYGGAVVMMAEKRRPFYVAAAAAECIEGFIIPIWLLLRLQMTFDYMPGLQSPPPLRT
jgi:hypothetical protein